MANQPDTQVGPNNPNAGGGASPQDLQQAATLLGGSGASYTPVISNAATAAEQAGQQMQPPVVQRVLPPVQQHHSTMSKVLHAIGDAIAPPTRPGINPETGAIEPQKRSTGERVGGLVATLVRGAAAGAAQHGPGAAGKAALAGVQAEQQFQQQQTENLDEAAKLKQQQLRDQFAHVLQQQQFAESTFRLTRLQVAADREDADLWNSMQAQLADNPGNHFLVHLDNFSDLLKSHPELQSQGINLASLHSNNQLRIVPTAEGTKRTGFDVYQISPNWLKQRTSEPFTYRRAVGRDPKTLEPIYETQTVPAGAQTNEDQWKLKTALAKQAMDEDDKTLQLQNEAATGKATRAHLNAETKLVIQQSKSLIQEQQADPFGYVSDLPTKEALKRQDSFQKDIVNKAYDVEKSYQMMSSAYNEYLDAAKQGKELPTGAQSMLALSTHLSTTFGNVKGTRVTRDMIAEHLGARSVSDAALVAIQKLTNGDVLSPAQWKAFSDLISQSRNMTWANAISNAKNQHLPITFLPRGNGQDVPDRATGKLYLDAAEGDYAKAETAMRKQGWRF